MTPDDFQRTLQAFQRRKPFRPFTVELVGGERFEVDRPDALVFRGGQAAFVAAGGTPVLFDHESVSRMIGEARGERAS